MNLHQLRFVQEAVRRNLNLTETAKALFTSQPGVSKAILELELELGVDLFVRHGKRLTRITEAGHEALKAIEVILREVHNLKRIGEQFSSAESGTLSIATTHTQARYFLPEPIAQLRRSHPQVQVVLHQGVPGDVVRMLMDDVADVGIATEALAEHAGLISLPCYEWQHVLIVPPTHPLATATRPTLAQLAAYPLVLYHPTMTGRSRIDHAFERANLKPVVALEAIDSDVIKTYVRVGLGVGIVTELAVREDATPAGQAAQAPAQANLESSHSSNIALPLAWQPLGHLFGSNVTRVAFKRGAYLRSFVKTFAASLSPRLSAPLLEQALRGEGSHYTL
jgi:LysR family transcriptional regulator, cys regulon transcriptional activator